MSGSKYFLGLISGTSMDGIDAAVAEFSSVTRPALATLTKPYPEALQRRLRLADAHLRIAEAAALDAAVGDAFAAAAREAIALAGVGPGAVRAIGSHGQTVWHGGDAGRRLSVQIGDPNRIAESLGITTVADFRRRDIAAGGEGAPLAPAFHEGLLREHRPCCVINLGGIANLTVLDEGAGPPHGFDSGPGNTLMDAWCRCHLGHPYDHDGRWAAAGEVSLPLLDRLLADDYFREPPPKSTGPEYFNLSWLTGHMRGESAVDVQATLLELTARTIAEVIATTASSAASRRVFLCGGGAGNDGLVDRLKALLAPASVASTAEVGIDPDYVEALGFAWLARQTLLGLPGNVPAVTGARHQVILGGIYPGGSE